MEEELLDWELLHGSDTESTDSITSDKKSESSSVIDDGMMILSDHFTLHNPIKRSGETTDPTQNGVVELDDSFRVDYGSEPPNQRQNPGEFRVDSSSGHLDVNRSGDADVRNELGSSDFPCRGSISNSEISSDGGEVRGNDFEADDEKHVESEIVAELTGGTLSHYEDASMCLPESDHFKEPIEDSGKSWSDSGGNEVVSGVVNGQEEIVSDSGVASTEEIQVSEENTVQAVAVNSGDESKSRETVWWKMPFVLLKYSAFRIGPLWSVSMAAAVMGIVLLGRRLYNMKKKAQRFHLKVAIDDKKVSRVMSQAARLNEVFTEVRRIPVIRPALPSPGAWPPVLSLR